jgi:hypothetical protein
MSPSLKKAAIFIAIYLLIFCAVVLFALMPATSSLKQNKTQFSQKQSELNATYTKLNSLQKIEKHPEDFKKTTDSVKNFWPDSLDVGQFLIQTDTLAKSNSLILENVTVNEVKAVKVTPKNDSDDKDDDSNPAPADSKSKTPASTQFTFSFKSSYPSVLSFIKGMETLPRFNSLSSIALSGNEDDTIEAKLTGNIYYGK